MSVPSVSMENETKQASYRALVTDRKCCCLCAKHLENASRIDGGDLDSNEIGPYTRWQGNLESPLVVVAQDFADVAGFRKYCGWAGHDVRTNRHLVELVREAGFVIAPPKLGKPDNVLFFTNAVLCMKAGGRRGRQQPVPQRCFANCSEFLRRTITIVAPRVVVTLGRGALSAIQREFGLSERGRLSDLVGRHLHLTNTIYLVPMYHPSPTVVNTHRPLNEMRADWRALRPLFEAADNLPHTSAAA